MGKRKTCKDMGRTDMNMEGERKEEEEGGDKKE
jgi:hypothetical protein